MGLAPVIEAGINRRGFTVSHPGDWEGCPLWYEAMAVLEGKWVDR